MKFRAASLYSIVCAIIGLSLVTVAGLSYGAGWCESIISSDQGELSLAICNAAYRGDMDGLKQIVENKRPDLNAPDSRGMRPLDVAFSSVVIYWYPLPSTTIIYLVKKGANPNMPLASGAYPLMKAAYRGDVELVAALVAAGAHVNASSAGDGATALHEAAFCDFRLSSDDRAKATIEFLLKHGANILTKTADGRSVLDMMTTPCKNQPELCTEDKIASAEWPTGACKQTYLYVRQAIATANGK